jgi:prepilin-type N-terminal cleavage/methylation domain-containing protein
MKRLLKSQRGFGLIEVIIALGLLGIVSIAFLGALANASSAIIVSDEQTTAESLASSELEYIKSQSYINYSANPHAVYDSISAPEHYAIDTTVAPFEPDSGDTYPQVGGIYAQDDGIQLVTIEITFLPESKVILTLEGYKSQVS